MFSLTATNINISFSYFLLFLSFSLQICPPSSGLKKRSVNCKTRKRNNKSLKVYYFD